MGRRYLVLGTIGLSTLPIFIALIQLLSLERFLPSDFVFASGSIMGLFAFMILFWEYVLGARFIARRLTSDVIWLNSVHQFLGKYGFVLILMHPLLVYLDKIMLGVGIPFPSIITEYDRLVLLGQLGFFLIGGIWITSAITRGKLGYRWWKRIHLITYSILFLIFLHSTQIGFFLNDISISWLKVYWLVLFGIFFTITIIRLLAQFGIAKRQYVITNKKKLTYDTFSLYLKPIKSSSRISPKLGQFVYIQHSLTGESHPYTISHFNNESGEIAISTKNLGKFSEELGKVSVGTKVYLDGPYGVFTKEAYTTSRPIVLIAGGIGITPFVRMLDYFKLNADKNPGITLFYGNKTLDDIVFKSDFDNLDDNKFKVIHVLSNSEEVIPSFERGYITVDLIKKYLDKDLPSYDYFLCGPPIMMQKLIPAIRQAGVPIAQIYSEKFSL